MEHQQATILFVDDQEDIRKLVIDALSDEDIQVRTAESGDEGMALVAADATIRLLITDIEMPGMDGWELARRARELRPALKVLYASGVTGDIPAAGWRQGPILAKPWRTADLLREVRDALKPDAADDTPSASAA